MPTGETIWDWIVQHVLVNPVSLISVALAIYLFFRNKRFKCLAFSFKSTSFVRDYQSKIPDLELSCKGLKVPNITLTRFVVWNIGRETNEETDIAKADPLRLTVPPSYVFLNYELIPPFRDANIITLTQSPDRLTIDLGFNFLDRHDRMEFDVPHTGSAQDIAFQGTIKGARPLKYYRAVRARSSKLRRRALTIWFSIFLVIIILLLAFTKTRIFGFALGGLVMANLWSEYLLRSARVGKIPNNLEHFIEPI